jgi:hypothetical protein
MAGSAVAESVAVRPGRGLDGEEVRESFRRRPADLGRMLDVPQAPIV